MGSGPPPPRVQAHRPPPSGPESCSVRLSPGSVAPPPQRLRKCQPQQLAQADPLRPCPGPLPADPAQPTGALGSRSPRDGQVTPLSWDTVEPGAHCLRSDMRFGEEMLAGPSDRIQSSAPPVSMATSWASAPHGLHAPPPATLRAWPGAGGACPARGSGAWSERTAHRRAFLPGTRAVPAVVRGGSTASPGG